MAYKYSKLSVVLVSMNFDLTIGDELLKKTNARNLFMVFGEPDVDIRWDKAGQIRSNSTNKVTCWFIDTDYDSEGFFVRHAYFAVTNEAYEKLKCTVRAKYF